MGDTWNEQEGLAIIRKTFLAQQLYNDAPDLPLFLFLHPFLEEEASSFPPQSRCFFDSSLSVSFSVFFSGDDNASMQFVMTHGGGGGRGEAASE